jgi:hypothetical protein
MIIAGQKDLFFVHPFQKRFYILSSFPLKTPGNDQK